MSQIQVKWIDSGRESQCLPDLRFPDGIDVDLKKRPACKVLLPYPAPRCGYFVVHCKRCGSVVMVTTAGRIDDPRSLTMSCLIPAGWKVKDVAAEVLETETVEE